METYKAALAPFNAAKAQPGDLTDADKFALGIGVAQAARGCLTLSADTSAFAADAKELLALGELCIFGQKYEPARATLVTYLALPQPPERKLALVLLIRALLGLGDPDNADLELSTLLNDYPYDAQIHFAVDQVINALESVDGNAKDSLRTWQLLPLCDTQRALSLPLLISGKGLESKDISASPSVLFADAIRCVVVAAAAGQTSASDTLHQLTAIAQQSSWAGTAELAPMQSSLARQQMVGARVPLSALHGHVLSNNTILPHTVSSPRHCAPVALYPLGSKYSGCGRRSGPVCSATAHLRNHQLECEHRPEGCTVERDSDGFAFVAPDSSAPRLDAHRAGYRVKRLSHRHVSCRHRDPRWSCALEWPALQQRGEHMLLRALGDGARRP